MIKMRKKFPNLLSLLLGYKITTTTHSNKLSLCFLYTTNKLNAMQNEKYMKKKILIKLNLLLFFNIRLILFVIIVL